MWRLINDNGDTFEVDEVSFDKTWSKNEILWTTVDGCLTAHVVSFRPGWCIPLDSIRFAFYPPNIKKVIFNDPATIVLWDDGTKTVVKCQEGDEYSKEKGLALCIAKKHLGNKSNFNNEFKRWINE